MAARKKKTGRPRSSMTKDTEEAILRGVRLGLHPDRAAQTAGIPSATMRAHKRRHPEFATALKMAAAHAEAGFLGRIIKSADKQWTAAAWILERRFPERWKRRDDLDVSAKIKGNVSMSGPEAPRGEALASYLEQLSQMPSTIRSRLDKK